MIILDYKSSKVIVQKSTCAFTQSVSFTLDRMNIMSSSWALVGLDYARNEWLISKGAIRILFFG